MKIKIIDLIIKIVNNEELPKKIKYNGDIYILESDEIFEFFTYKTIDYGKYDTEGNRLGKALFLDNCYMHFYSEVEIIEEDKKIKYPILHKTAPSETTGDQMPNWRNLIDCNFEYLNKTICQLIDEINNLKEK